MRLLIMLIDIFLISLYCILSQLNKQSRENKLVLKKENQWKRRRDVPEFGTVAMVLDPQQSQDSGGRNVMLSTGPNAIDPAETPPW